MNETNKNIKKVFRSLEKVVASSYKTTFINDINSNDIKLLSKITHYILKPKKQGLLSKHDRRLILCTLESKQRKGYPRKEITYNAVKDAYKAFKIGLRPRYMIKFSEDIV